MVNKSYMLAKPAGPAAPQRFVDQTVIPLMINVAGACELGLQRLSDRLSVKPVLILGATAGIAVVLTGLALSKRQARYRA